MKLWRFSNPHDHAYARAGRVGGTWQAGEPWERLKPLTIEWEPDSDIVGDFVWAGLTTDIAISARVVDALREARVTGFEPREVKMVESKSARRRRPGTIVRLPYQGPPLFDLWVTSWVEMDGERSTFERDDQSRIRLTGVEREIDEQDPKTGEWRWVRIPRKEGEGLFVRSNTGIFRVKEASAGIFCSDEVKTLIEEREFTNVSFREMGEIIGA